mmetsp:Transcript_39307/g.40034  ORF Transcript_39307/g.40034 Transcript_39307/m.40034 type:complete len:177 (+) Transcript_39307:97-627(+)
MEGSGEIFFSPQKRKFDEMFKPKPESTPGKKSSESRVLECLVCGKKFTRGAVDLNRHQVAITLKHFFSSEKTNICTHQCMQCGYFFSTADHLILHTNQSSCSRYIDSNKKKESATSSDTFGDVSVSVSESNDRKAKRGRVMIPAERKTFYAIISLLLKSGDESSLSLSLSLKTLQS